MISSEQKQEATAKPTVSEPRSLTPDTRSPARAWTLRIAGTLMFLALLVWLDLRGTLPVDKVLATLARANVLLVALSIALYLPFLAVKGARWRTVCLDMRMPLEWRDAWHIYAIGLAAGTFTPGQAGDMLKAWYLQRRGNSLARALGSSVLDRLFDVAALAVLGLLGVAVYGGRFAGQTPALVLLTVGCIAVACFFLWTTSRDWALAIVRRRLSRLGLVTQDESAPSQDAWTLHPTTLVNIALLTIASFATSIFRVWLLAAALGIMLGPLEVSGFVGLTTAAALVPVTVGGVGTRDTVAALALGQLGRSVTEAVALSSLILLLNLTQAIIGWIIWLRYKP